MCFISSYSNDDRFNSLHNHVAMRLKNDMIHPNENTRYKLVLPWNKEGMEDCVEGWVSILKFNEIRHVRKTYVWDCSKHRNTIWMKDEAFKPLHFYHINYMVDVFGDYSLSELDESDIWYPVVSINKRRQTFVWSFPSWTSEKKLRIHDRMIINKQMQ